MKISPKELNKIQNAEEERMKEFIEKYKSLREEYGFEIVANTQLNVQKCSTTSSE